MRVHRFQVFTGRIRRFPVCIAVRRSHPFPFRHSRDIPNRDVFFSCVSIFIHILLYRCGDGGIYIVSVFRHMRAVSVDCAIIYVGFYYLHWYSFFFPSFSRQYFAGVNWQVAKRTKVLSASM